MSNKVELKDQELENVVGGEITYTWDGTVGTLGINGNNPYILLDKDAFVSYYKSVRGTGVKEKAVLSYLLANGIIKLP